MANERSVERKGNAKSAESSGFTPSARVGLALLIAFLVGVYTYSVVIGWIEAHEKIDIAHLVMIGVSLVAIVLLLEPRVLDRFENFDFFGLKVGLRDELSKMKHEQQDLKRILENIELLFPLLLPDAERQHLVNLHVGRTDRYRGGRAVQSEIRRIRNLGMIAIKKDRYVAEMKGGVNFDLAEYVEFTERGKEWVDRLLRVENRSKEEMTATSEEVGDEAQEDTSTDPEENSE